MYADTFRHAMRLLLLAVCTSASAACIDPMRPGGAALPVPSTGYEAAVVVQPIASSDARVTDHLLRIRWRSGDAAPPLGGFQVELRLPPGLEPVGDVMDQRAAHGTMLRQLNAEGARVLASGVASDGFSAGDLFVLTVRGPVERVREVSLVLQDIVDHRGGDRRSAVRVRREAQ